MWNNSEVNFMAVLQNQDSRVLKVNIFAFVNTVKRIGKHVFYKLVRQRFLVVI